MQFDGTVSINSSRQKVWDFLTDPNAVAQCAPGLESLEIIEPDKKFRVVASVGLGNIKAKFTVNVEWVESEPPVRAKMKAHGDAPGSAVDIVSEMVLNEIDENITELDWSADIQVLGTIASLASRMMGGVTEKMTGEFFNCVKSKIEKD